MNTISPSPTSSTPSSSVNIGIILHKIILNYFFVGVVVGSIAGVVVVIIIVIILIIILSSICYLSKKKKSKKNTCMDVVWTNNKKAECETSKRSHLGETELIDIDDLECNLNYWRENYEVEPVDINVKVIVLCSFFEPN